MLNYHGLVKQLDLPAGRKAPAELAYDDIRAGPHRDRRAGRVAARRPGLHGDQIALTLDHGVLSAPASTST